MWIHADQKGVLLNPDADVNTTTLLGHALLEKYSWKPWHGSQTAILQYAFAEVKDDPVSSRVWGSCAKHCKDMQPRRQI